MYPYAHLTLSEREKILYLKATGNSITSIANKPGRNKFTISRELKRNKCTFSNDYGNYQPSLAQAAYEKRRKRWSPEEIQGRLKLENDKLQISYPSIYRAIYKGVFNAQEIGVHS
ncbi:helix-turn-helix domain-containing protein [Amygdalobacter nucleatus]|uniref:Transposase IS30-like HTH domain-containing protein n=1 Tax=Amygdalobacter nucleatus TaxID=3029274 RepID=A0A133YEU4_9FIRM|nr:helix-turn-helix domain-containing protein [Amygdalobacter nucleatus]KXB41657.1 hypothetical protein HMPREF1872_00608 [Amygdalobacter nucleatus]MDF0486318.1 helix-turn-helix domain-containing protein [Amygdalobacter nucleatus]